MGTYLVNFLYLESRVPSGQRPSCTKRTSPPSTTLFSLMELHNTFLIVLHCTHPQHVKYVRELHWQWQQFIGYHSLWPQLAAWFAINNTQESSIQQHPSTSRAISHQSTTLAACNQVAGCAWQCCSITTFGTRSSPVVHASTAYLLPCCFPYATAFPGPDAPAATLPGSGLTLMWPARPLHQRASGGGGQGGQGRGVAKKTVGGMPVVSFFCCTNLGAAGLAGVLGIIA